MKLNYLLAASLLMVASTPAFAAKDVGFYLGGQVNHTSVEDNIGDFDESAWGLGSYGGYNFNDSFGLEAAVYVTDSFLDEMDFRIAAMTLSPLVRHAFSDAVTVYLKAGLVVNITYSNDEGVDDNYRGTGWLLGTGVDVTLSESLALRFSYEFSATEPEYSELDNYYADIRSDQFAVGLHYRF